MSSEIYKKVELTANVAIIIVAVLLGYFLVQQFTSPNPNKSQQPPKEIVRGTKIDLPNVDLQSNGKTILLVMQKSCHFCTESMPFYKNLIQRASEKGVKVIAVLPDSIEQSNQYLNEHGIKVNEVRQSSLSSVDVEGTPTLIMLNQKGEVSNSWVGKLPSEKEQEVINQL